MSQTIARPRRGLSTFFVGPLVRAGGVVAVGALALGSLSGCTLFSEDFEPQGAAATQARADALVRVADLADGAAAGGRVIATATRDGCISGQNNWKIRDTYSHECAVEASRLVVVTTGATSVADELTAGDARLRALGCRPTAFGGLDRVRDEYWRPDNPNVDGQGASGLPMVTYVCGDRELVVQPMSARASETALGLLVESRLGTDELLSADWYANDDILALRESDAELAFVVTASEGYYRTRF